MAASPPSSPEAFGPVRWLRLGYVADEVDAFVDRLTRGLEHDPPTVAPYEVADTRFHVRRTGRRYGMREIDDYLDRAQERLRTAHGAHAVADLEGHTSEPRHVSTLWIYALALLLVAGMLAFALTQL